YIGQNRYQDALEILERARPIIERTGSPLDVMTNLANIAAPHRRPGPPAGGIALNQRVVELATANDSKTRLIDALSDIGESQGALENRASAIASIGRAIDWAKGGR